MVFNSSINKCSAATFKIKKIPTNSGNSRIVGDWNTECYQTRLSLSTVEFYDKKRQVEYDRARSPAAGPDYKFNNTTRAEYLFSPAPLNLSTKNKKVPTS